MRRSVCWTGDGNREEGETAADGLLESWGLDLEELRCRMKIYD